MTSIYANTSVVLVDTATAPPPYIVYFQNNANVGGIITVRDNDGYASTGNSIVLSTVTGTSFSGNQSTILINQPYGFITLSIQPDGTYSILNTFAFPTGSDTAYVYNLNTNNLNIQDKTNTSIFNKLTTSTNLLYYNDNLVGDITNTNLTTTLYSLSNSIQTQINQTNIVRTYVAVGTAIPSVATGTIQFSDDLGANWYNAIKGPIGFYNGGIDISKDTYGYYVACGDNSSINPRFNSINPGYIQWSFDGKSWVNSTSPDLIPSQIRTRVHFARGIWHALGSDSGSQSILWSTDRQIWNSSISIAGGIFNQQSIYTSIAYGNGIWVCCGSNSITNDAYSMIWSSDGSNWNLNSITNNSSYFYDIIYTGTNFISVASNSFNTNILRSSTGSNNWINTGINLNNESGYLGTNSILTMLLTTTYHKYTLDNGITWRDMTNFPSGIPTRPYYDGSVWWVGMKNNINNTYNSTDGTNTWISLINPTTNALFPNGYPTGFVSLNTSSNLNIQLVSTVYGLEQSFSISSLQTTDLTINTFTIRNSSTNILTITNNDPAGELAVNNISTNFIKTNSFYTNIFSIDNMNTNILNVNTQENAVSIFASTITASTFYTTYSYTSTLFASTIFTSDVITTSSIIADVITTSSIIADFVSTSLINVSSLIVTNTINTPHILSDTINVSNLLNVSTAIISSLSASTSILSLVYADTISTNTAIASTIQLIDNDGSLRELYTVSNNLYFQGTIINTAAINPLYFRYTLFDLTGATPAAGQFSITTANSSGNLIVLQTLTISAQDLSLKQLFGFYNKVAINSVIHIINTLLNSDHIYRINSITLPDSADHILIGVTMLSGNSEIAVINNIYSMFIESIGIPPPPNTPANIVTVYAKVSATRFDLTSANTLVNIPSNIGTYIQGTTNGSQFGINLNNTTYSVSHIPALIGSIVYYTGGGYIVANVKCGSISATNGAYIVMDGGVQTITVSGLTLTNFSSATNDLNNGYALYITLQFLN